MKSLKEFAGLEVNKTKMDQIRGGKSVVSYEVIDSDAYNWDYELHWSDGTTTEKYLPK